MLYCLVPQLMTLLWGLNHFRGVRRALTTFSSRCGSSLRSANQTKLVTRMLTNRRGKRSEEGFPEEVLTTLVLVK